MKNTFKKAPLVLALSGVIASTVHVQALEYNSGDFSLQFDNNVSYGVAWRTAKPDSGQILQPNGVAMGIPEGSRGWGSSYNYDDGTLNYKKGDVYTNVFKWNGDLELKYENVGAFVRARAWYDTEIMDGTTRFKPLPEASKSYAGRGAEVLDAFVWADFTLLGAPSNIRVGRQVINWGESTFIQGGVGSINPVDASAARRPGAEIKEALLPVNMVFASIGLTDSTTLEAFYQLQWEKTRTDPCGTFFSTVDFVADGCGPVLLTHTADEASGTFPPATIVPRIEDETPRDDGQFGVALRTYTNILGGAEFGFYYTNLHSRMPYINGKLLTNPYDNASSTPLPYAPDPTLNRMAYQIAYPENVEVMGISMATSLPNGASFSSELTYKPNSPLQWNAFELIFAGVPYGAPDYSQFFQKRAKELGVDIAQLKAGNAAEEAKIIGKVIDGYDKLDVWQFQSTYIQFFDRVLGGDQLALAVEVGVNYVPDLPSTDVARYGRSGAYGIGEFSGSLGTCETHPALKNANTNYCTDKGYVTEWSGGIRVRSGLTYNNAFAGINVTPNINLAYDMGYAPEPGAQFIDKRLVYALGLNFVYQNNASLDVVYQGFEGGDYDQMVDRDNVSLAVKYAF